MSTWPVESQEKELFSFLLSVYMQVDSFALVMAAPGRLRLLTLLKFWSNQ